jgi:hypothetical protein
LRIFGYALTGILFGSTGLVTAALTRPKNRAADAAAGAITGLVAALTAFTLSYGWVFVILTAVLPADDDLRLLTRAAWEGQAAGQPAPGLLNPDDLPAAELLLQKYPDLRALPPPARSAVLHDKLRADQMARVPLGIWLGLLFVLGLAENIGIAGTMVAGPLLRRHRRIAAVALPYLEVAVPGTVLIFLAFGLLFGLYVDKLTVQVWHAVLALFLVLTVGAALRGWPWFVRLLVQAGWLFALGMLGVNKGWH